MDTRHIFVIILLGLSVTTVSQAQGLQCPSCTYLTATDIPDLVKTVVNGILDLFQDPECAQTLKGPIAQIKEETCRADSGKVSRCSFYKGSITLKVPVIFTTIEMPFQLAQRGCYYSLPANVPGNGCHDRRNINEDKTILKQILNKVSSTFEDWDVAKFEGQQCLCTDTYCKDVNGAIQSAILYPALFVMQFLAVFLIF